MPNRKSQPKIKNVETFNLSEPGRASIKNISPVYYFESGIEPVVKIDIVFRAGARFSTPTLAKACSELLTEGTLNYPGQQFNKTVDFYGAFIITEVNFDVASVSLITLRHLIPKTVPLLIETISSPQFHENELKVYKETKSAKVRELGQKGGTIAKHRFMELLFPGHPYSKHINLPDIETLTRQDLINFHSRHYNLSNMHALVSGNINKYDIDIINRYLGKIPVGKKASPVHTEAKYKPETIEIQNPYSTQASVRLGLPTISKKHPDYFALKITNTLLGGYFGSRLMTNIRENSGYTYGINSMVLSMHQGAYFTIVSEVNAGKVNEITNQIIDELDRLSNTAVQDNELKRVKSVMNGELMNLLDGPFNQADAYESAIEFGYDFNYFNEYIHAINHCDAALIKNTAKKHIKTDKLAMVIVKPGKQNA